MHGQTLVAVYASRGEAERVRDRLRDVGVPESDIRLSVDTDDDRRFASAGGDTTANPLAPKEHESFWDWLLGSDVPETDQAWYQSNLREGRTAVSVRLHEGVDGERVTDILEQSDPISMEDGAPSVPQAGLATGVAGSGIGASQTLERSPGATTGAQTQAGTGRTIGEGDQVIPVVKEELEVGKRAVEQRQRICTYVVERPVEEQVTLRDERVVVERRPVSGERAADPGALQEREFEVIERHEEPVVGKKAKATEEVVVHKEAKEHTETVRDTVRETKVEVDKKAAGSKPSTTLGTETIHEDDRPVNDGIRPDKKI